MAFNESMQKLVETFFDLLDEQGKYPDPSKPLENQFNYIVNELISMIKQPTTYQVIITGLEDVLAEHEKDEDRVTGVKAFLYTIGIRVDGISKGMVHKIIKAMPKDMVEDYDWTATTLIGLLTGLRAELITRDDKVIAIFDDITNEINADVELADAINHELHNRSGLEKYDIIDIPWYRPSIREYCERKISSTGKQYWVLKDGFKLDKDDGRNCIKVFTALQDGNIVAYLD